MRVRGLLFDFDHTLVHSPLDFAGMRRGVMELLAAYDTRVEGAEGKLILELVDEAASTLPSERGEALRAACAAHILEVELEAAALAEVLAGVPEALARLRAEGRRVGIITRNCREVVERVLQNLPLEHDVLMARDDVSRVKPAPEHAWEALAAMGVAPDDALMVGDFRADIECARRAGLPAVGVTTGSNDAATLQAAGAIAVLDSAAALPDWLAQRGW